MTLTTVQVTIDTATLTSAPLPRGRVRFELLAAGAENGIIVVPGTAYTADLDDDGHCVPTLWGHAMARYAVTIISETGKVQLTGQATVPPNDCSLHEILDLVLPPPNESRDFMLKSRDWAIKIDGPVEGAELSAKAHAEAADADRVQTGLDRAKASDWAIKTSGPVEGAELSAKAHAQGAKADRVQADQAAAAAAADRYQTGIDRAKASDWAIKTSGPVEGSELSAKAHAQAAHADRQQADLDAVATAADRVQTGLDRTQTGGDRVQTGQDVAATTAARDLAAGYANVLQQNLAGFSGQPLHRSPNPIAALFVYDTSKDSDGGAWVDRCQHTSWYNEPLNGKWLGACASEAAARAVSGAATGDYFQLTTDGRFYKLNAGAGTTEVFRGNTEKFPRLAAIVAEAASLTIYDLTQPGRPMWMRFAASASNNAIRGSITGIVGREGALCVAHSAGGSLIDLAGDRGYNWSAAGRMRYRGRISDRNALLGWDVEDSTKAIVNSTAHAVAATTLPDAPVDPATGLQVPTIAVMTAGGVSAIKHDGSVSSHAFSYVGTYDVDAVTFTNGYLLYGNATNVVGIRYSKVAEITGASFAGASFATLTLANGTCASSIKGGLNATQYTRRGSTISNPNYLDLWRLNPSDKDKSLRGIITPYSNTGFMVGDIRRCWLADTMAENLSAPELLTNGSFVDLSGWTAYFGNVILVSGAARVTSDGNDSSARIARTMATIPGKTYRITGSGTGGTAAAWIGVDLSGSVSIGTAITGTVSVAAGTSGTFDAYFTATGAATSLLLYVSTVAGQYADFDNLSVKEVVADRSYKAKPLTINGTLAKTPVATGAQLVFFSNWSAANCLQEAPSADLDPGTGGVTMSIWGTIPVGVAAAGWAVDRSAAAGAFYKFGHDATGKLVASFSDGTTTRTATTTNAYNTGTAIKARAELSTSGTVTIKVNGQPVTTATGAPLLTLSNASATCTVGIDRGLTAPWAGGLALVKIGMTSPTAEQSVWMYEQEKQMFRDGAQVTLPDAGALVDMAYDDMEDKLKTASAGYEASFVGLVRVSSSPVSDGSFTKVAMRGGVKLLARSGTNPGVDVTIPAYGLREELYNRAERAAALSRPLVPFDFDAILGQTDFALPSGYTAAQVKSTRADQREGSSKDFTRGFDGFVETIKFVAGRSAGEWVQLVARRA
jgi:trimeric autotransporter adhesin